MKKNQGASLPQEILSKILIELPAKTLLRFSCVSKAWLSLIRDPYFVESHHARSYSRSGGVNLIVCSEEYVSRRHTYNLSHTDVEGNSPLKHLTMVNDLPTSSVHGLICAGRYILNPATKESFLLPAIVQTISLDTYTIEKRYTTHYLLGFDSSNNSYKVLCSIWIDYKDCYIDKGIDLKFKIFELGGTSWRDIEDVPSLKIDRSVSWFHPARTSCSIDNLIFFHMRISQSLLVFDVKCERFETIPNPDGFSPCDMIQGEEYIYLIDRKIETMWILEDYKKHQWRRISIVIGPLLQHMQSKAEEFHRTIARYSCCGSCVYVTPLCVINGKILLQFDVCREILYYYYNYIGNMNVQIVSELSNKPSANIWFKKYVETMVRLK